MPVSTKVGACVVVLCLAGAVQAGQPPIESMFGVALGEPLPAWAPVLWFGEPYQGDANEYLVNHAPDKYLVSAWVVPSTGAVARVELFASFRAGMECVRQLSAFRKMTAEHYAEPITLEADQWAWRLARDGREAYGRCVSTMGGLLWRLLYGIVDTALAAKAEIEAGAAPD